MVSETDQKPDIASGIEQETESFAKTAEDLLNYCKEEEIIHRVRQSELIEVVGVIGDETPPTIVEAIINDVKPHDLATDLKDGFDARFNALMEHVEPRTKRLVEHTLLSEREAQAFLLDKVPAGTQGQTGIRTPTIRLVLSRLSERDELLARQTIGNYISRAEDKIETGMTTRFFAQFLGRPPEGYPEVNEDFTPRSTVPLRTDTLNRIRRRQRRASEGTTIDDIVQAGLDASRTVTPIREFIQEYMDARPAVGLVVLTNQPPKEDSKKLAIQGVVDGEYSQHGGHSTIPVEGIHQSQNPARGDRPAIVRETDAVRVGGEEYSLSWDETVGYDPDYMRWIYTEPDAIGPSESRPDVGLDEGVEDLTTWINHVDESASNP